jgi:hypothetical protein
VPRRNEISTLSGISLTPDAQDLAELSATIPADMQKRPGCS